LLGLANEAKRHFAVQFHPEVELTVNGRTMFADVKVRIPSL
jgi:anthranilate/para-aminobenzoate synthase component II